MATPTPTIDDAVALLERLTAPSGPEVEPEAPAPPRKHILVYGTARMFPLARALRDSALDLDVIVRTGRKSALDSGAADGLDARFATSFESERIVCDVVLREAPDHGASAGLLCWSRGDGTAHARYVVTYQRGIGPAGLGPQEIVGLIAVESNDFVEACPHGYVGPVERPLDLDGQPAGDDVLGFTESALVACAIDPEATAGHIALGGIPAFNPRVFAARRLWLPPWPYYPATAHVRARVVETTLREQGVLLRDGRRLAHAPHLVHAGGTDGDVGYAIGTAQTLSRAESNTWVSVAEGLMYPTSLESARDAFHGLDDLIA